MTDGWVKLWRKSLESGWLQNGDLWRFWCYCLIKATHKPIKQLVGYQQVCLEPGQFIFGRKQASIDLKMSEQTARTCLEKLKIMENLTIKSTNKFSIITIANWNTYQCDCDEDNHQSNKPVTNNQPTTNHKQEQKNKRSIYVSPNGETLSSKTALDESALEKIPYEAIISHLNSKTGKSFDHKTKVTRQHIKARWNEGHRIADFIKVIDNMCARWLTDARMIDYLRPQTLFATKFESYLNSGNGGPPKAETWAERKTRELKEKGLYESCDI